MPPRPHLEWGLRARLDLAAIIARNADDDPDAAQHLKDAIERKVEKLPDYPTLYRMSVRVEGMREMVVRRNYIVLIADAGRGRHPRAA